MINRTSKSSTRRSEEPAPEGLHSDEEILRGQPKSGSLPPSHSNGKSKPPSNEIGTDLQRERYETFIRNSSEGIWRIEFTEPIILSQEKAEIAKQIIERGIIVECNQALAQMFGFQYPEEIVGKHSLDFVADMDVCIASKVKFVEQDFSVTNVETIEKDRFGDIHYFENSYIGEVSEGKLVRVWGIQSDATEKRHLQEQLRTSENRYRNLVEQANDMVIVFNNRGEFVFANKKFFELTKYETREITGKKISEIVPPDTSDVVMRVINEQFNSPGQGLRYTLKLFTRFNEERIVELSMTTLHTAEKAAEILATGRDVTEEQEVRSALHESEEKYRSLVEHSLLGVLVIQNNLIAYANPTLCNLFEATMEHIIGNSLDNFVHPNDYVLLLDKFSEAALSSAPGSSQGNYFPGQRSSAGKDVQFTIRVMTATGRIKTLDGWAAGISYLGMPAIQAAVVDVTDTKILEEQLIQSQKMESIGQLASGVAHDFNNLLGSIYGVIGILKNRYANSDQSLGKYVEILDSSAQRAAELTSQLLTFSRQHESDIKPVRLNDIVNDSMKILIRSIGKNIRIESALDPTLYTIEADASQIESVILNFSINSRDAMPNGGTLRIETSNAELFRQKVRHIPDGRPGKFVCLTVSDTGAGMDHETQRRIFEPFFTTKPLGKGTGLGLSIVYGIVKNHKGFIDVYSDPGHGTTFKVYFPTTDKPPLDEVAPVTTEIPRGTETILLIDDEVTLLNLTKEILEGLGYKVLIAEGAAAGIEVYKQLYSKVDLVILDMLMPEMTGGEVYPVLKSINHDAAVLLATGLNVGEQVDDMVSKGVNDVIGKPYSVSDLALHVRKALDRK